jgi:hypothetical protein
MHLMIFLGTDYADLLYPFFRFREIRVIRA